jgi:hypothetical protein
MWEACEDAANEKNPDKADSKFRASVLEYLDTQSDLYKKWVKYLQSGKLRVNQLADLMGKEDWGKQSNTYNRLLSDPSYTDRPGLLLASGLAQISVKPTEEINTDIQLAIKKARGDHKASRQEIGEMMLTMIKLADRPQVAVIALKSALGVFPALSRETVRHVLHDQSIPSEVVPILQQWLLDRLAGKINKMLTKE